MTARCALNMGVLKIFESPWVCPRQLFPKFLMGCCSGWVGVGNPNFFTFSFHCDAARGHVELKLITSVQCVCTKMALTDLHVDWLFGEAERSSSFITQSWGRGGRRGSAMVPFEIALVISYRASTVTFPLSLCASGILPLLCSSTPLFPTPPPVSPKFPHVPWE